MCDVSKDAEIESLFAKLKDRYGKLHTHCSLRRIRSRRGTEGDFVNTTREGFRVATRRQCLLADCGRARRRSADGRWQIDHHHDLLCVGKSRPPLQRNGRGKSGLECSVRYLAYELGKKKIRVNAISAGPIKTLAARGIAGLGDMLKSHEERAPLGRNVEVDEVGSPESFSPLTPVAASPAKSSSWTAAITSWAFRSSPSLLLV